jgi:uncharacterized membrane protein YczE
MLIEEKVHCIETLICELSQALGVQTGIGTVCFCYFPTKQI